MNLEDFVLLSAWHRVGTCHVCMNKCKKRFGDTRPPAVALLPLGWDLSPLKSTSAVSTTVTQQAKMSLDLVE